MDFSKSSYAVHALFRMSIRSVDLVIYFSSLSECQLTYHFLFSSVLSKTLRSSNVFLVPTHVFSLLPNEHSQMAWHPTQNFMSLFHNEFNMFGHDDNSSDVYDTICYYKIVNRTTKSKSWQSALVETTTKYHRQVDGILGCMRTNLTMREQHNNSAFDLTVYRVVSSPESVAHQLHHVKSTLENIDSNITVLTAQFASSLPADKARTVVDVSRRLEVSTVAQGLLREQQHFSNWSQLFAAAIRLQVRAAPPRAIPSPAIPLHAASPEAQVGLFRNDPYSHGIPEWFRTEENGFVVPSAPYINPNACNSVTGNHI